MAETPRRKLTTVMSADVDGYSRLMDRDEVGTLERLIAYRKAMAGLIERHRGRVVNTASGSWAPGTPSSTTASGCCSGSASTSET